MEPQVNRKNIKKGKRKYTMTPEDRARRTELMRELGKRKQTEKTRKAVIETINRVNNTPEIIEKRNKILRSKKVRLAKSKFMKKLTKEGKIPYITDPNSDFHKKKIKAIKEFYKKRREAGIPHPTKIRKAKEKEQMDKKFPKIIKKRINDYCGVITESDFKDLHNG